jgi:SulP family sulfate permease
MPTAPHGNGTIRHLFPFIKWLHAYRRNDLWHDALAGLTVAIVLIPQAMAYAMLAGLPPVYGLYAAAVTPWIGALWGSLRQLATGPIAIMSLLVLTALRPLAEPGSPLFIELALGLSLLVGAIYLLLGLLRLGIMMTFISNPAVRGFTSAAALIIIATQLPHLLGISVGHHDYIFSMIFEIGGRLPDTHIPTLIVGAGAFMVIYGIKRVEPRFPAALLAILLTAGIIALFGLHDKGIAIIGKVPEGLPTWHLPRVPPAVVVDLIGPAIVIALVSFAETYAVSKTVSTETKQIIHLDQELIGQGLANLVGGFFQCYPVSGSFSRTAINFDSGARTPVASLITSLTVLPALLFMTPLLAHIPRATLAALVIGAVLLLFHPKELLNVWRLSRNDGIVAVSVFVLSLLIKPDYALLIGVVISLVFFLWKTMHPRIVRITRNPISGQFINADLKSAPTCPQILHLRVDDALYFGNAEYTMEQILSLVEQQPPTLKFLLLDFQTVGFIDLTAAEELMLLHDELGHLGITLALTGLHRPVKAVLDRTGLLAALGKELVSAHKGEAVAQIFAGLDHETCRKRCSQSLFRECGTVKS